MQTAKILQPHKLLMLIPVLMVQTGDITGVPMIGAAPAENLTYTETYVQMQTQ
jgi:hypothetical protein